ncbi:TPR-like protein [Agrocybe pediades]|nr:TPR-like protein [Agrocybe pediades]
MPKGAVPASAAELKKEANALYCKKRFNDAEKLYTQIIIQEGRVRTTPEEFMKTIWSNRAACYIELGEYDRAIMDLSLVLGKERPTSTTGVYPKAYYRLALCFLELGYYEESRRYLDDYVKLTGENAFQDPVAKELQNRIAKHPPTAKGDSESKNRPVMYLIKVLTDDINSAGIIKHEQVPASFCVPNINPVREQLKEYLATTILKYNDEIFHMRPWRCWNCGQRAASLSHTPTSYLSHIVPTIISFILPVCGKDGPCDKEAEKFMYENLSGLT